MPALHLLAGSPAADGVEVFEREAERVDLLVAGGTGGVRGMGFELHADRRLRLVARRRRERLDVRRRRRRRSAEDRFGDPHAAMDRAMPRAIGGERQDGGVREQSAAMIFRTQLHFLKVRRFQRGHPVVQSQSRIEHRPVRGEELAERQVLLEDRIEVERRLQHHAFFEPLVVVGIKIRIGGELADAVQLQPLPGEGGR